MSESQDVDSKCDGIDTAVICFREFVVRKASCSRPLRSPLGMLACGFLRSAIGGRRIIDRSMEITYCSRYPFDWRQTYYWTSRPAPVPEFQIVNFDFQLLWRP